MEEHNKYLEEEIKRIEVEILHTQELVGELGEEAEKEVAKLVEQKSALEKALAGDSAESGDVQIQQFKHITMEFRSGVGGDEAKIWADDLARMYMRYSEKKKWKVEILDESVLRISGRDVYTMLQYETGVHRVQRVPATEAQGRIHTSTASIVVLPEVAESLIEIKDDDLSWEFTRAGGHGGQNVNKVSTAVRLLHKPSGIVVGARQERSQEQNRKLAMSLLRAELWEVEEEKKRSKLEGQRSKIGRAMRSEKVRTYNYPQNRVTDHRIGKSWHKLEMIMEGDLDDVLTAMATGEELGNDNSHSDDSGADNE